MNSSEVASKFIEKFWEWRLNNAPEFATSIGIHKYDNRLDEMSLNSYDRRENETQLLLKELNKVRDLCKSNPDKDLQLNLTLLKNDLEQYVNGLSFKTFLWPVNQLEGPQTDFPRLLSFMKKMKPNDLKLILERMQKFPQQIDETITLLQEGVANGITLHEVSVKPVVKVLESFNDSNIEKNFQFLFESPKCGTFLPPTEFQVFVDEAKSVIHSDIFPSYKKLNNYLKEKYLQNTRKEVSVSSVRNGKELYAACLKFHTTTNMSAKEIYDVGVSEVEKITQRMKDVMTEVKFQGTFEEFRQFMKNDSQFRFKSADEIEIHYTQLGVQIRKVLPNYFTKMPKADYKVIRMSEDSAPSMPGAYYLAPPEDGSRPGSFLINTYKPETKLKYEAVALSLHEAEPGHHLQSSLAMEAGSLVEFRRFFEDRKYYEPPARFPMNTGYIEGWGLYSEYLGEEMGLYADPYDMFGRLSHEMLRACRLVVDTGLHAFNWSRQQAIDYMSTNTATDPQNIVAEIDRYITWPGQACGYKVGEIKIKAIRSAAAAKLGDKFDVKLFHDFVASIGSIPLSVLEDQILNVFVKNMS